MKNLISIYIVSKNYGKFVEKAIKSIFDQTYKNWELFLVSDNSKDNTEKIFKKFISKNKKIKKIFLYKKNTGLQKISNNILKICKGEFLLRLDADDWLNKNALLLMINKILSKKNYGAVYGGYYYVDVNGKKIGLEDNLETIDNSNFPPHGACTLFKCRALKEVGGYSTNVKAQDGWDIWLKLKGRVEFSSIDLPLFYYRKHGNSVSSNYKKILKERGKIINQFNNTNKGGYKLKILGVVPIKKDFFDIKNAPYLKYQKKTLIEHTVNSIKKSKMITDILLSTNNKKIINFSKRKFSKIKNIEYFLRSKKYEKSLYGNLEKLLLDSSNYFKAKNKFSPDIIVFFNIHVIRKDVSHIDKAIKILVEQKKDTVYSVVKEKNPIFSFKRGKMEVLNKGRFNNLDYNNEIILNFNNSIIVSWDEVIRNNSIFDGDLGFIETSEKDIYKFI